MNNEDILKHFLGAVQVNGNVNIGQVNMGDGVYYATSEKETATSDKQPAEAKAASTASVSSEFPDGAEKYWQKLQQHGFTDEHHHLLSSTTRAQAMLIADCFADAVGIKSKWKTFETVWGINNLAQEKWKMQENGRRPSRADEIKAIFEV